MNNTNHVELAKSGRFVATKVALRLFLLLVVFLSFESFAHTGMKAGDILVLDQIGETGSSGALFVVNPKTGQRTLLSDFGNSTQGGLGDAPSSIAIGSTGRIFVSDLFAGAPDFGGVLFEVNPDSGSRVVVSNFGIGEIKDALSYGIDVNARGRVFAVINSQAIVRINPHNGTRSLISDFDNPKQGIIDHLITDIVLERSGTLLSGAIGEFAGTYSSKIFRVDTVTGVRTVLSDFQDFAQGVDVGDLQFSIGLAMEKSGTLLATSGSSIYAPRSLLFRIDTLNFRAHREKQPCAF